jgi:hypothetical protein
MTKTVLVPVGLGNPDKPKDDPVYLEPGDEVPSWAEDHIKPEYMSDNEVMAAGTNLYDDNIYQVVKGVADERGVEYDEGWDAAQIAAAVRLGEHNDALVERVGVDLDEDEVETAVDDSQKAMKDLFGETNSSGNVNAPDQAAPKRSRSSRSSESTGGSDS